MNTYDKKDRISLVSVIIAGPIKLGAYRVRDPETDEWSKLQFHLTYDNTVMAVMEESAAKMFSKFVTDTMAPDRNGPVIESGLVSDPNSSSGFRIGPAGD